MSFQRPFLDLEAPFRQKFGFSQTDFWALQHFTSKTRFAMDIIWMNIGWILLFITLAVVFGYKLLSGDPTAVTAKYRTALLLPDHVPDLDERIYRALQKAGFRKIGKDPAEARFYARAGFSFWSFSEYIEVLIKEENGNNTLEFFSICAMPTQVLDWGKNKRNAKAFLKEFNRQDQTLTKAA